VSLGAVFAAYSYMVLLSVPLTALGLGCVVLGSTLLMVPESAVPSREVKAMIEGGLVNVEAVLEEYDARGRAVYLPPNEGRVQAFVPISENPHMDAINPDTVPRRVLTEAGGVRGVMVFPLGSEAVRLSQLPEDVDAEDTLSHVLVDFIEIVESIKYVRSGAEVVVELGRPRLASEYPRVNTCFGSFSVSVAGCVLAHVLRSLVYFKGEEVSGSSVIGYFEVRAPHG
jgi:hypothetical protein